LPLPFGEAGSLTDWDNLYLRISRVTAERDDFDDPTLVREIKDLTYDALRL
jgi:hypothetical protein